MRRFIALFLNIGLVHNLVLGDGCTQVVEINQDLTYKIILAHKADLSTNDFCLEVVKLGSDSSTPTKYDITDTPRLNDLKLQKELLGAFSQKIRDTKEGKLPNQEEVEKLVCSVGDDVKESVKPFPGLESDIIEETAGLPAEGGPLVLKLRNRVASLCLKPKKLF